MAKADAPSGRIKIRGYLDEIEKLKKLDYKKGNESKKQISEKIRALINVVFDDAKDKLKHYKDQGSYPDYGGMLVLNYSEEDENYRYRDGLDLMKRQLIGFDEELSLIETSKARSKKLDELENAIKEKKLEAERRNAVVETKRAGAEIELLTFLREELKRRDNNTKIISEIHEKISALDEKISHITIQQPKIAHQEDTMLKDILEYTNNDHDLFDTQKEAKQLFSKIKARREQIRTLEKQHSQYNDGLIRNRIAGKISSIQSEITRLLDEMTEIWSTFSN